jgi:hypothetical protein
MRGGYRTVGQLAVGRLEADSDRLKLRETADVPPVEWREPGRAVSMLACSPWPFPASPSPCNAATARAGSSSARRRRPDQVQGRQGQSRPMRDAARQAGLANGPGRTGSTTLTPDLMSSFGPAHEGGNGAWRIAGARRHVVTGLSENVRCRMTCGGLAVRVWRPQPRSNNKGGGSP